eukprot:PhF_6_TR43427/c0_g1_i1/m.66731
MGAVASIPGQPGVTVPPGANPNSQGSTPTKKTDGDGNALPSDSELLRQTRSVLVPLGVDGVMQTIIDTARQAGGFGVVPLLDSSLGRVVLRALVTSLVEGDPVRHGRVLSETVHCANEWTESHFDAIKTAVLGGLEKILRESWSPAISSAYESTCGVFLNCWLTGIVEHCKGSECECHTTVVSSSPLARKEARSAANGRRVTFTEVTSTTECSE